MFWSNWFFDILGALNLYHKDAKIAFLGLDNAGKSTLLYMMTQNRLTVCEPTILPNVDEVFIGRLRLKIFDLGGHETARRLWDEYMTTVDAVVFLVDANDRSRLPEAKVELQGMLKCEGMTGVPILVLGNKIDVPMACSEEELKYELGLMHTYGKDDVDGYEYVDEAQPVEVFMCSVMRRMGYKEGFEWLSQFL